MNVNNKIFDNLTNKTLIASPYMLDELFDKSLIYMLSHTAEGAMGLIFNHFVDHTAIKSFFNIVDDKIDEHLTMPLYLGGPVEHQRGFFLHSDDYNKNLLLKCPNNLALSSNPEISYDIAHGNGPKNSLFIIGYTVWKSGQLEEEIKNNFWIVTDSDQEFIFSEHPESNEYPDNKWRQALENFGIKKSHFIIQTSNA